MIQRLIAAALAAVVIALPAQAQTVVLVRHGEKAGPTGDVDLSAAGQARARDLAQTLSGAKVTLVLATTFKRTGQTAQPTATAAGLPVVTINFDGGDRAHIQRVAARARQAGRGDTVLIVGHSNTITEIARALGDPAPTPISDCDYDRMTVLRLDGKTASAIHTRYGVPTQSC
ncbi:phosphoglycerate mutase family protein [soil metagenome]